MLYLARSSPKLCWHSRAPSALALTCSPGTDFLSAREIKLASPLVSGLKRKEFSKAAATTNEQSRIAAATILYRRERLMLSLWNRVKVFASIAAACTRGWQWFSTLRGSWIWYGPGHLGTRGLGNVRGQWHTRKDWHSRIEASSVSRTFQRN